jgi:sterol desaturase/sphingolipid hydroxylase (fatty acid hydroxylase superfamily)
MRLEADDYQIVSFFALIVVFSVMERLRPAWPVNRLKDLKIDLLSFAFALTVNRLVTRIISAASLDLTPHSLRDPVTYLQQLPSAVRILLAILVTDFAIYWIHRSQHTFATMWRTHAWHHSIEEMYWFAGFRTSFFHSLLNNIPQVVIPMALFQLSPAEAGIGYSIGVFIQFVEHTNWNLSFGPLNWLLVTPDYHRIHHAATLHRGKNIAGTFRIWDMMFGTYVNPATVPAGYALGLGEDIDSRRIPRLLAGV